MLMYLPAYYNLSNYIYVFPFDPFPKEGPKDLILIIDDIFFYMKTKSSITMCTRKSINFFSLFTLHTHS